MQRCALGHSIIHQPLDESTLRIHHHGTAIHHVLAQRTSLPQAPYLFHNRRNEVMRDALVHKQTFHATAILATILKASPHRPRYDILQLDILAENHGILPSKFQNDGFQKRCRSLHNVPPNIRTPREENLVHVGTLHERLARFGHTRAQLYELRIEPVHFQRGAAYRVKVHGAPAGVFGTLSHDAVPTKDSGQDVIEHVVKGVVPGGDDSKDSQGDVFDVSIFVYHHGIDGSFAGFQPGLAVVE
mmetsp:Transcript_12827/g.23249  ORF Transcript_12827/g.23249 Transcript_12827/m.23249 type:complete len:244 (-) Transcript_12827:770-1501(-)